MMLIVLILAATAQAVVSAPPVEVSNLATSGLALLPFGSASLAVTVVTAATIPASQ
jgi:hypothetical protein